jgi:hypothetical protein
MTEMLNIPLEIPPFMRPYGGAMLYGLWGWPSRVLQVVVKAGAPISLGTSRKAPRRLRVQRVAMPTRWIASCVH